MGSSSKASDSALIQSKKFEEERGKEEISYIHGSLCQLKKQIQASRLISIQEKLEKNKNDLRVHTSQLFDLASRAVRGSENMLTFRMSNALCKLSGWESSKELGDKEFVNSQEEIQSSVSLAFGGNGGGKNIVRFVKLPFVEKISPYTTWIFLDRNQRMAEDQSVVGRRRIYYDPYGNETLICSDSDEEIAEPEEEKHDFSEGEDQILWKALQEHGLSQEVLDILCQFVEASPSEIQERYDILKDKNQEKPVKKSESSGELKSEGKVFLDKTLSSALDSFENLFCRRCLIFDCRLHGCSQSLIIPSDKQSPGLEVEENRNPCGEQCYLKARESTTSTEKSGTEETGRMEHLQAFCDLDTVTPEVPSKATGKRKVLRHENMPVEKTKLVEKCLSPSDKKQRILSSSDASPVSKDVITDTKCLESGSSDSGQLLREAVDESVGHLSHTDACHDNRISAINEENNDSKVSLAKNSSNLSKGQTSHGWTVMEKDLYMKGIEIFGKNSCLIARNLLFGLKTCMEVSKFMFSDGALLPSRPLSSTSCIEDSERADHDYMDQEMPTKTRIWRRRGRAKKLKYTWKSAGHPSSRKRIADGKHQSCQQYTPCGCQLTCGKECPCFHNGTCCEKYCGCSKSCKNRFRGCHCAKSQCRSRQCPCFAAGRECDPDVCRNCWVSCGDGSLGEPPARGDGYQCGNMKLLLKQQQRILLAKSDVAGWGAFIKNPVNKNDYLGEYTGELISHKEADKRGKIYDRANSSFLFDLNDQYVLDAYRKGDKLKFANHSSNPNCYAKVMLVAGDHRVGIFAKEHIEASEELFYDYRYGPDQAPAWARKPEGSKRDDSSVHHSRAHKVA